MKCERTIPSHSDFSLKFVEVVQNATNPATCTLSGSIENLKNLADVMTSKLFQVALHKQFTATLWNLNSKSEDEDLEGLR